MSTRARTLLAAAWFVFATLALVAPAWTWWGNRVEPRVFGLPWSLTSILLVVALDFAVLLALYAARWIDAGEAADQDEGAK
jgi:hypothetical protein